MMWWFFILACGIVAIAWAGMSFYLRVSRHMKTPDGVPHKDNEITED